MDMIDLYAEEILVHLAEQPHRGVAGRRGEVLVNLARAVTGTPTVKVDGNDRDYWNTSMALLRLEGEGRVRIIRSRATASHRGNEIESIWLAKDDNNREGSA